MNRMQRMSVMALAALAVSSAFADYATLKKDALKRHRTTAYYACGFEPCLWPKSLKFSVDSFASIRLNSLAQTRANIDMVIYQPLGVFGVLSANVPSAERPTVQPSPESRHLLPYANHLGDMIKAGTDPVKEVVKWGEKNKKEIVVSLPVNSVEHASADVIAKPPPPYRFDNYFFPQFKVKNQNLLMGGTGAKLPKDVKGGGTHPPYSRWSMVNYGEETIRAKYVAMATDLVNNYAVDGLLVDFMKDPSLFISVAWGGVASAKECQQITDMMLKVRAAVDAAGAKRNKACLLYVRVPDSIQYCKEIGIDLQALLDQKCIDVLVVGGQFDLNPLSYTADIAKKAGVPYMLCSTQSGIWVGNDTGFSSDDELIPRHSQECFRGRVMMAHENNAMGCIWENPYWWQRFSLAAIPNGDFSDAKGKNKRYCVTYRNSGSANSFLKDGAKHRNIPNLVSGSPIELKKGAVKQSVVVWDDAASLKKAKCTLVTEAIIPGGMDIVVQLNGKPVKLAKKRSGHQYFDLPAGLVVHGPNEIVVKQSGRNKRGLNAKLCNVVIDVVLDDKETK